MIVIKVEISTVVPVVTYEFTARENAKTKEANSVIYYLCCYSNYIDDSYLKFYSSANVITDIILSVITFFLFFLYIFEIGFKLNVQL